MKKIIDGLLGKQRKGVFLDGKVLKNGEDSRGVEILNSWSSYVLTEKEEQAKELFDNEYISVVYGNKSNVSISQNWAALTACIPNDETDFDFFVNRTSQANGLIVYSYENLSFDDEYIMKEHFERCRDLYGIKIEQHLQEDGKKYLIGRRTHKSLLNLLEFDEFKKLFYGPIIDTSIIKIHLKFKDRAYWNHPTRFFEKETPVWKNDFFFESENILASFFDDAVKPKFLGGTIEVPNHERLIILLASGAINKEVETDDGRIVILKGTERISYDRHLKYDIEGNVIGEIEKQVRNTLIYEFDMTNGEFSELI